MIRAFSRVAGRVGVLGRRRFGLPQTMGASSVTERQKELIRSTFIDFQSHDDFLANPVVMARSKGLEYWDVDGARYFDGIGGIYTCSLGHLHPEIVAAAKAQLDVMTFNPPMHSISDVTLSFVEKLGSVAPGDLNFVKAFCSASEATECALKFTRSYHKLTGNYGKYKFISRWDSWHGATAGAVAASGGAFRKTPHEPHMAGFMKVPHQLMYRDRQPWSWEECNRFCAETIRDSIENEDPDTIAGVILEPIMNTGGIMTPTTEFYEMVREMCDEHNVTLIFDETITGFCKTGEMFASQSFGVTPDIIVCGKGMSNGTVPISAMIASDKMATAFNTEGAGKMFAHGQTFAGQPLATAVGLAVLNYMTDHDLAARSRQIGAKIRAEFEQLKTEFNCIREVRGMGVLLGVEFGKPIPESPYYEKWGELGAAMKVSALRNKLIIRADHNGWFAVAPALCATDDEIDELCSLVRKSLVEALDELEA